ncbi:MAG TPA: glycoside hydrolase family 3 N-terminal domain-containing protein [Anaerolineaceae bacterium]|nr:glycoside hydrolase family 3 N-terminal domain-containing protein [Anaerolineaceae bacterium]
MSYRDATLPISRRVASLLAQMTLDEKLAQIYSYWMFDLLDANHQLAPEKIKDLLSNGIGQITRAGGGSAFDPLSSAKAVNMIQRYLTTETRLGIPAIVHEECCCGYMALGATVFPQMLGMASSFQPELAQQMANVIRAQMRRVGAHQGLGPVLDVGRDARWGRIEETFGEDPTLISQFGAAYIRGLQGESLTEGGVMATGKHFIGHSLTQAGQNCAPVHLGKRELWDIYLAPFQAAIRDAGLHSIMNSYPEIDGEVVAASRPILTGLLRSQLGFEGLIVSDYEAILMLESYHRVAADKSSAAAMALNAGIEVELPAPACYREGLTEALENGRVNLEAIDAAVSRHLQKKFELGLFENPYVDEGRVLEVFDTPEQRKLAHQIARQSMVLLTNNGTLPLPKTLSKLAVIGPNADEWRNLLGDYTYTAMREYMLSIAPPESALKGIDPSVINSHAVKVPTILESIREAVPATQVLYARGCDILGKDRSGFESAVLAANEADAVVLVLGDRSGLVPDCSTGETRDSVDLRLPGAQNELATAVLDIGKPVVIILINGRPLAIPELAERASAILEAWLPGEAGGPAVAEILFGYANPGGKLPLTFPRHVGQLPIFYNQKPSGGKSYWYTDYVSEVSSPLFPFGHGLSYTAFDYTKFSISCNECRAGETVDVQVVVENTGQLDGDEVVQLYVCDEHACVPRPVKELKGFVRLELQPGENRKVIFHLPVNQLAFYDQDMNLVVESGFIKVMVGSSSTDIRCEGGFGITGDQKTPVADRVFVCPVDIE